MSHALPPSFYARPTLTVARELIGKLLVHDHAEGLTTGWIVEVEAYVGESDPACHAAAGLTPRNAPLYGPPGRAYVYLNYGLHYLVNAVTEPEGAPAAVLIRALEPVDGVPLMTRRRAGARRSSIDEHALCRGPGNLTQALGITLDRNQVDLCAGPLRVEERPRGPRVVEWSRRIGIRVGADRPWRCAEVGNKCVSGGYTTGKGPERPRRRRRSAVRRG